LEISREAQEKLARVLGGDSGNLTDNSASSQDARADGDTGVSAPPTTLAAVARIIEDVSGVPHEDVAADSDLSGDLDISSVALIEISVRIEDTLRVRIEEDEIWSARTVADLVTLIDAKAESAQE